MLRTCRLLAGIALIALAVGCDGKVKEETIPVKEQDPMLQVQATLQNYIDGQPVASEVTSYDFMVAEVRKKDPGKADILKAGLDEIKSMRGSPAPKARELMKKLGLQETKTPLK